jgi:thioredoxin-related protein
MAGENVVFVYLTNQTSPENTYAAMIPEIKGEHYRLSADQWNYLAGKFNISGIPHYVLAGKNGEVINPKLGFMSNEAIKAELEKRIKE